MLFFYNDVIDTVDNSQVITEVNRSLRIDFDNRLAETIDEVSLQ